MMDWMEYDYTKSQRVIVTQIRLLISRVSDSQLAKFANLDWCLL